MRTTARETRDALQEIAIAHQVVTMTVETPATSVEVPHEVMTSPAESMVEPTATPSNQIETVLEAQFHEKIHETFQVVIHHEPPELS